MVNPMPKGSKNKKTVADAERNIYLIGRGECMAGPRKRRHVSSIMARKMNRSSSVRANPYAKNRGHKMPLPSGRILLKPKRIKMTIITDTRDIIWQNSRTSLLSVCLCSIGWTGIASLRMDRNCFAQDVYCCEVVV